MVKKATLRRKVAKTVRKFGPNEVRPPLLGNEFWKARSSHGRKPRFASPEDLWDAAQQYFEWNRNNPLYEDSVKVIDNQVVHVPIPHIRAMTIGGLCIFLDISRVSWETYCKNEDFLSVTEAIAEVIRDQKFTGAAADLLNANIIARDLGLVDKSERSGNSGPSVVVIQADPLQNIWDKLSGMIERLDGGQPKKLIDR